MTTNSYLQLRVNYSNLLNTQTNTFHQQTELVFVVGELQYGMNEKSEIVKAHKISDTRIGFASTDQLKEVRAILDKIIQTAESLEPINEQAGKLLNDSMVCSYAKDGAEPCKKPVYQCGVCKEHYAEFLDNEQGDD